MKPCKNHVFCLNPSTEDDCCPQCLYLFGGPLVIKHEPIDCHVCWERKEIQVSFPAGCGHRHCLDCTQRIVFPTTAGGKEDYDDKVNRYMYRSHQARCSLCRSYAFNNSGIYML